LSQAGDVEDLTVTAAQLSLPAARTQRASPCSHQALQSARGHATVFGGTEFGGTNRHAWRQRRA